VKSARDILWEDGLPILRFLTGKPECAARAMLRRMLCEAKNECARLMTVLDDAQSMHPLTDAEAWLMQAVKGQTARASSRLSGWRDRLQRGRGTQSDGRVVRCDGYWHVPAQTAAAPAHPHALLLLPEVCPVLGIISVETPALTSTRMGDIASA